MVCLAAVLATLFAVIQKIMTYGDVISSQSQNPTEELPLPDIMLCLPAYTAQVSFNSGGWQKDSSGGWTTNGCLFHGNRQDDYNGGKRCQGYSPKYPSEHYAENFPCVPFGYSHTTKTDFTKPWDGKDGDSLYMTNNEAKWDWPDSYYENSATSNPARRKVTRAILYEDDKVYDGSSDFDANTYKAKAMVQDEMATAMAEKRTWEHETTPIKTRCFVFKNPMEDEKPKIIQDREDKHLWFSFRLNIGVTFNSATSYMLGQMWFVKPGTDPSETDGPPDLEVPFHNSMNAIELTLEKLTDRTREDQETKTVYHASLQSNTQKLYHEKPESNTFNGQLSWTEIAFRMTPSAPVTHTNKRKRGFGDIAADFGGLWTFMFVIIGIFFKPSGLIDSNGNSIHVFAFLRPAHKLKLLKEQTLFEADGAKATQTAKGEEQPTPL